MAVHTNARDAARNNAIQTLRDQIKPGTTLRTILRHTSRSGMSRSISVVHDGEDITYLVARALGDNIDQRHDGIKVPGAGMDIGFRLVYSLSQTLFPLGFDCLGDRTADLPRCPSNDHSNGDRDYTPHLHQSGGFALRQRWL